jgi:hypothetical protein
VEARKYTVRGLSLRGQFHMLDGSHPDAEADLLAALQLADSICYLPARVESRMRLSRLYSQTGPEVLGERHFADASGLVADLDSQIQNPELRFSFERGILRDLDQHR